MLVVPSTTIDATTTASSGDDDLECCRLVTDSGPGRKLFSVRSRLDKTQERGFVLLCGEDNQDGPQQPTNLESSSTSSSILQEGLLEMEQQQQEEEEEEAPPDPEWPGRTTCYVRACEGQGADCAHIQACRYTYSVCSTVLKYVRMYYIGVSDTCSSPMKIRNNAM